MDLCLSSIPLATDKRPSWLRTAPTAKSWTKLIEHNRYDGIREDANYAFRELDSHSAFVPTVSRNNDTLKMEWREDGKFFVLFLSPDAIPRWASGHDGGIVEIETGRPLAEVIPGLAAWLSPKKEAV